MDTKIDAKIKFLLEADKMKSVFRRNVLLDRSRRENDAEHSWHLALCAMLFEEYAAQKVDMLRVLKMAILHDIIEIYAGDTFAYDAKANEDKKEREKLAADKIFGMLPKDCAEEFRSLFEEFDEAKTPDAVFANCMDRVQAFIGNYYSDGHTWVMGDVTREQILSRVGITEKAVPALWQTISSMIDDGIKKGYIK